MTSTDKRESTNPCTSPIKKTTLPNHLEEESNTSINTFSSPLPLFPPQEYQFPPEAIGGMAAGGLFLVLVSMVILVVYRRKSNQAEREYKRIQIQMDTLESNVRSECKQGKAERR